jgi:hypothetical protein
VLYLSYKMHLDQCPGSARNLPLTALITQHSGITLNAYFRPEPAFHKTSGSGLDRLLDEISDVNEAVAVHVTTGEAKVHTL